MKQIIFCLISIILLVSCTPDEPKAKYVYELNPNYSWGYAEYYGQFYADYKNTNNVLSLSLFSDSLTLTNDGELAGLGQYLYIEDIFVPNNLKYLAEGTYNSSESGEPFTFYPGQQFPVDDVKINVGAFLYYFEKNKSFTAMKHISRGSFTVKITDLKHIVDCDFVLSDSSKVTGTFTDTLPHFDFSSQSMELPRHKVKLPL